MGALTLASNIFDKHPSANDINISNTLNILFQNLNKEICMDNFHNKQVMYETIFNPDVQFFETPVTFKLIRGNGLVYIHGQNIRNT